MLNTTNQNIANQIAAAYCNVNSLCKSSLVSRLNNVFDDNTFPVFLSDLTSKAYFWGRFVFLNNEGALGVSGKYRFNYVDVITGEAKSKDVIFPKIYFNTDNFTIMLRAVSPNISLVKTLPGEDVLFKDNSFHYDIAYTTNPGSGSGGSGSGGSGSGGSTGGSGSGGSGSGGSGSGGSTGGSGSGSIIIPDNNLVPGQTSTSQTNVLSSIDFEKYLIPAGVVLVAYLLLKK